MPRTTATARSIATARTVASPRTEIGAYRLPYEFIDLGINHYWDYRTAKLGTNSPSVADLINMRSMRYRGTSALATVYAGGGYYIDLERSNSDYLATEGFSYGTSITSITYFFWIKRESTGTTQHIFADWETSANQRGSRLYIVSDAIQLDVSVNGTSSASYTSTETLTDTASWHFLVVTYDTTNRCVMTLDGVNLTVSRTAGSDPASINSSNVAKLIGANVPSAPVNFFDGLIGIGGVCINKVLSTAEKAYLRTVTNTLGSYT